jgi:hypothetical protein
MSARSEGSNQGAFFQAPAPDFLFWRLPSAGLADALEGGAMVGANDRVWGSEMMRGATDPAA